MLRALKWAYDRGVQHERMRIKKLIGEFGGEFERERAAFQATHDGDRQKMKASLDLHNAALHLVYKLLWKEEQTFQPRGYSPIDDEGPTK